MSLILGIDPGLRLTGFGIIQVHPGGRLEPVGKGVCRIPFHPADLAPRLQAIHSAIEQIVKEHRPNCAVVEKVFVNCNPQSALLLGQARGTALAALAGQGVPVYEYTALQIKQAVTGHGHATKPQVQWMVQQLLRFTEALQADAADALACAICHAHGSSSLPAQPLRKRRKRRWLSLPPNARTV